MDLRVGCCGWPVGRAVYSRRFALVEIQETFYNLPRPGTAVRWRAGAPARQRTPLPEGARPRYGAFKPTAEVHAAWRATAELARVLGARIVVFQCPPSFTPTAEHRRNLEAFFGEIDRGGLTLAWEPRGAWEDAEIERLCRRLDLIHCVDPFQRPPAWGSPAYFRLHGRDGYHYRYTDAELAELLGICRGFEAVYCLFNNTHMFEDARRFLRLLGAGTGLEPGEESSRPGRGGPIRASR